MEEPPEDLPHSPTLTHAPWSGSVCLMCGRLLMCEERISVDTQVQAPGPWSACLDG